MTAVLASLRWLVLHLLRQPLTWLWFFVASAAWPLVLLFTPRALTSDAYLARDLIYEVAFTCLTLGAALGALVLDRAAWFLHPKGPLERSAHELAALAGTAALLTLPSVALPLLLTRAAPQASLDLGEWACRCTVTHLHLSALVIVLLRIPIRPGARACALLVAVWLLPALLGPDRGLVACLDAGRLLFGGFGTVPVDLAWKPAIAPIMGWLGVALLMRAPSPVHALRHPR